MFENGFVRNNEEQWYQKDNAACRDGHLVITGREDIKRNPQYVKGSTDPAETKFIEFTSSSLMTKGLHQWTMGRFVARAKIPHGEGMWPAFWMVGAKGEWPSSGEIDIMEYYQNTILANVAHGNRTGGEHLPRLHFSFSFFSDLNFELRPQYGDISEVC